MTVAEPELYYWVKLAKPYILEGDGYVVSHKDGTSSQLKAGSVLPVGTKAVVIEILQPPPASDIGIGVMLEVAPFGIHGEPSAIVIVTQDFVERI